MPPDAQRVLLARSLRAFGDGYVAILLPVHLSSLGLNALAVGEVSTAIQRGVLVSGILFVDFTGISRRNSLPSWASKVSFGSR